MQLNRIFRKTYFILLLLSLPLLQDLLAATGAEILPNSKVLVQRLIDQKRSGIAPFLQLGKAPPPQEIRPDMVANDKQLSLTYAISKLTGISIGDTKEHAVRIFPETKTSAVLVPERAGIELYQLQLLHSVETVPAPLRYMGTSAGEMVHIRFQSGKVTEIGDSMGRYVVK